MAGLISNAKVLLTNVLIIKGCHTSMIVMIMIKDITNSYIYHRTFGSHFFLSCLKTCFSLIMLSCKAIF